MSVLLKQREFSEVIALSVTVIRDGAGSKAPLPLEGLQGLGHLVIALFLFALPFLMDRALEAIQIDAENVFAQLFMVADKLVSGSYLMD